jgi:type II secretory pathway component GspD/PulD (secretin)
MFLRIFAILFPLALASCQSARSPSAPPAPAPLAVTPAVPSAPLGITSVIDQTTTKLLIYHWDLVRSFPDQSAPPLHAAGVSLSIDPTAHVLIISGPPSAVTSACDLFTFLDALSLSCSIRKLNHSNPSILAAMLNTLFATTDDRIQPPAIRSFLAMPANDLLLLFAFPQTLKEADNLLSGLDVDSKSAAKFDPSKRIRIQFKNTTTEDILAYYSQSFGTIFIQSESIPANITLDAPPMDQQQALSLLDDILIPLGFKVTKATIAGDLPRTIVRIETHYSDGRVPDVVAGTDPYKEPSTGVIYQVIPLFHASPFAIANYARSHMFGTADFFVQPNTNSLVVYGNANDIHELLLILPQLDK